MEKFKNDAQRQARLLFILDQIAKDENIDVSGDDLESAYKSISAQTARSEEEVKNYYEAEELVDSLKNKLREEKTVRFLLDNAEIIER